MGERRVTADGRVLERQADGSIQVVGTVGGVASNPIKVREATTGIDNTAAQAQGRQIDNRVASATVVPQIRQVGAEAAKTEAQATTAQQGTRMNGLGDKQYSDALGQYNAALQIQRQRADLRKTYNNGPGATKGFPAGLADFMPGVMNEGNQRFDTAANRMRAFAKSGTGTTGGENNTAAEMKLNLGSYIPSASNWDSTTEDNFGAIGDLGDKGFHEAIQRLGGVPDAMGNIHPIDSPEGKQLIGEYQALAAAGNAQRNDQAPPMMGSGNYNGGGGQGSGPMPGQMTIDDYAQPNGGQVGAATGMLRGPEFRQEHDTAYQQAAEAKLRAGASYAEMNQFAIQSGYGGIDQREYSAGVKSLHDYRASHGGRDYGGSIMTAPLKPVKQTGWERASQGIPGAIGIGLGNAGSFGALDLIAPDKMEMARSAHPWAEGAGEVAGMLTGTKILGGLGGQAGNAIGKAAPGAMGRLEARLAESPLTRNLALDTGYGTVRGGVSNPDDPLGGALQGGALAGLGSMGGSAVGSLVGRGVSGVTSSPTIARLRMQGVTPTLGQIMRGRAFDNGGKSAVASLEDMVANTPGVSTLVNSSRNRALEQGNTAGYQIGADGVAPIKGVGLDALHQLEGVRGNAYDDAFSGVSIPKNEPGLVKQLNAVDAGRGVDEYGRFVDTKLAPAMGRGDSIGGRKLQEALRMLQVNGKNYQKAAITNPAYGDVADALGQTENAFVGATARTHPAAIPKLKQANRINRNLSILDNAAEAASSEGGVWTGPQLGNAIKANNTKYGRRGFSGMGKSPLFQLQQDMTNVLPNKVPPTGVNAAPMLAAAGLLTGGANEASGLDSNAVRTASLLALLSTPYTRLGSKAVAKALLDRPAGVRALGSGARKYKGLLGTAAAGYALQPKD